MDILFGKSSAKKHTESKSSIHGFGFLSENVLKAVPLGIVGESLNENPHVEFPLQAFDLEDVRRTFAFFFDLSEYSLNFLVFHRAWFDQTLVHVDEIAEQLDEM